MLSNARASSPTSPVERTADGGLAKSPLAMARACSASWWSGSETSRASSAPSRVAATQAAVQAAGRRPVEGDRQGERQDRHDHGEHEEQREARPQRQEGSPPDPGASGAVPPQSRSIGETFSNRL